MKKRIAFIGIAIWMIAVSSLVTFSSCSKPEEKTIVGTWEMLNDSSEGTGKYWSFRTDNTCDISFADYELTGDYSIVGKKLILDMKCANGQYDSTGVSTIYSTTELDIVEIKNNKMQLSGAIHVLGYDTYYQVYWEDLYGTSDNCFTFRKVR